MSEDNKVVLAGKEFAMNFPSIWFYNRAQKVLGVDLVEEAVNLEKNPLKLIRNMDSEAKVAELVQIVCKEPIDASLLPLVSPKEILSALMGFFSGAVMNGKNHSGDTAPSGDTQAIKTE